MGSVARAPNARETTRQDGFLQALLPGLGLCCH